MRPTFRGTRSTASPPRFKVCITSARAQTSVGRAAAQLPVGCCTESREASVAQVCGGARLYAGPPLGCLLRWPRGRRMDDFLNQKSNGSPRALWCERDRKPKRAPAGAPSPTGPRRVRLAARVTGPVSARRSELRLPLRLASNPWPTAWGWESMSHVHDPCPCVHVHVIM